jgi:hypothetical protein
MPIEASQIGLIRPVGTESRSSLSSLVFQSLRTSGAFGVSPATQLKLARLQETGASLATRLEDLGTLRSKLDDLLKAGSALRRVPADFGNEIEVTGSTHQQNIIRLSLAQAEGLQTGDKITFSADIPGGEIRADTSYFISVVGSSGQNFDVKVFETRAEAMAGGTPLNVSSGSINNTTIRQIIPTPGDQIESLIEAFNGLQQFLAETTPGNGPLANDLFLSGLASKLTASVLPMLGFSDFAPAISTSPGSREINLDKEVLSEQIAAQAQSIASYFEDGAGFAGFEGIANRVRDLAASFIGMVDGIAGSTGRLSANLEGQISSLLQKAEQELTRGNAGILNIGGSLALTDMRIGFLRSLFNT